MCVYVFQLGISWKGLKSSHTALNVTGLSHKVSFLLAPLSVSLFLSLPAHLLTGLITHSSLCGAESQYHQDISFSSFPPFLPCKQSMLRPPYLRTIWPAPPASLLTPLHPLQPSHLPSSWLQFTVLVYHSLYPFTSLHAVFPTPQHTLL